MERPMAHETGDPRHPLIVGRCPQCQSDVVAALAEPTESVKLRKEWEAEGLTVRIEHGEAVRVRGHSCQPTKGGAE